MENLELLRTIAILTVLVLSVSVHEAAHAFTADLCGDRTARNLGRLTINPAAHIDPIWSVLIPLVLYLSAGFAFGGAKPVPVNFGALRRPLRDMAFVAAAGPISNLLIAAVLVLLYKLCVYPLGYPPDALLPEVLQQGAVLNVVLAAFNLMPLPPLDGSRMLMPLLPSQVRPLYASLERFGILLVMLFFFVLPGGSLFLGRVASSFWDFLWSATGGAWA